jgi:hypothetical protein
VRVDEGTGQCTPAAGTECINDPKEHWMMDGRGAERCTQRGFKYWNEGLMPNSTEFLFSK